MKVFIFLMLIISSAAFGYDKVKINGKLYVAKGFDDNDLVEVSVIGTLPNSCYRNPSFEIEKKDKKFAIRLYAHYIPSEDGCREISMAYSETINFGMMHAGNYDIALVNKSNTEKKELVVENSTSQLMDEFLYGNVTGVDENDANRRVELIGVNPVNCLVFEKMTADVQDAMIILRPHFKEVGFCEKKPTPFKISYTVPYLKNQPKGILLHVRIMNGRSYNYLYQNRL